MDINCNTIGKQLENNWKQLGNTWKTIGKQKLEQINWNAIGTELEPLEAYLEDIWKMLENNWNTHGKRLVNN